MLTISRPDVASDAITEFPAQTRFIKLPITNYLKLLGIYDTINAPQTALINAVNNPRYRFICAALARRLGKTYIANVIGQLVLLVPGCNVLIMSPNYNLSSISFELQRRLVKHFDLEIARDNLKDKLLELDNGSTIRMGSISTVDSTVGRSYDLIIFDEAALSAGGEAAFNVALRPTLDRPGAKAIFISTPRGRTNWFAKFFQRGFSLDYPEWCSIQADWTENPRMTEADVMEARRTMSSQEFNQEYCAEFAEFAGQIFQFDHKQQVLDFAAEDRCEFFAGCDPGYRDATAFIALAYNPGSDTYWVVDEYLQSGSSTLEHSNHFKTLIARWNIDSIFIDSAAAQFAADLAYTYDIPTIKAKKDVLPGIAFVQTLVEQRRLFVQPHCTQTLAMLDQYRWDVASTVREKPVHDEHSHLADALRYALYSFVV
jgi:hypothetical protein